MGRRWKWTVLPRKVVSGNELVLTSLYGISELLYIHPETDHNLEKQEISAE